MVDFDRRTVEFPIAYAVFNRNDFLISYTNRAFQSTFRTESWDQSRLGDLRLYDIFPFLDLVVGPSVPEGYVKCKRYDETSFLGWFRTFNVEGHPELQGLIVYENYEETVDEKSWSEFLEASYENVADISYLEMFSHEVNNALALFNLNLERVNLGQDERDLLNRPLSRLQMIASITTKMALTLNQRNSSQLNLSNSDPEAMGLEKSSADEKGNRVLIIDDDPELLESLAELLRISGFPVFEANSRRAAYEMMMTNKIDIAIIDLRLGNEDGRAVSKSLRRLKPSLSVIYMTGYSALIPQIELEGTFTVIKKPFKLETLISEINREIAK